VVAADYTDRAVWPSTPGLFGIYGRCVTWFVSWRSGLRGFGGWNSLQKLVGLATPVLGQTRPNQPVRGLENFTFGDSVAELLEQVTERLLLDVATRRLPIEPVRTKRKEATRLFSTQLALLPADVEGGLLANSVRPSLRRFVGLAALFAVEGLLAVVLAVAFWRTGKQFILGDEANGSMPLNAVFLLGLLISPVTCSPTCFSHPFGTGSALNSRDASMLPWTLRGRTRKPSCGTKWMASANWVGKAMSSFKRSTNPSNRSLAASAMTMRLGGCLATNGRPWPPFLDRLNPPCQSPSTGEVRGSNELPTVPKKPPRVAQRVLGHLWWNVGGSDSTHGFTSLIGP
jgi:hypothetical protein